MVFSKSTLNLGSTFPLRPGVPIAIARPYWEVTLNDTLQKRVRFLDAAGLGTLGPGGPNSFFVSRAVRVVEKPFLISKKRGFLSGEGVADKRI